jgi:hypothetical protein
MQICSAIKQRLRIDRLTTRWSSADGSSLRWGDDLLSNVLIVSLPQSEDSDGSHDSRQSPSEGFVELLTRRPFLLSRNLPILHQTPNPFNLQILIESVENMFRQFLPSYRYLQS